MTDLVNIGTNPNDGTGDSPRVAFSKLNTAIASLQALIDEIDASQTSGMLGYATLAALNADLAHAAGVIAIVTNDTTPENNIIYRKSGAPGAGSWVPQAEGVWALASLVDQVQVAVDTLNDYFRATGAEDAAFVITDAAGRSAFDIDSTDRARLQHLRAALDGLLHTYYDDAGTLNSTLKLLPAVSGYVFALLDADGRLALGVQEDGTVVCERIEAGEVIAAGGSVAGAMVPAIMTSEINHFFCYGQSWAVGLGTFAYAISGTQRFSSLMFNGGVRVQSTSDEPSVVYTSLVPLVEHLDTGTPEFPAMPAGETPAAGQTDMVMELLYHENHIAHTDVVYQLLASTPGEGSHTLDDLSKPSTYYTRLMAQVSYGYSLSQAAGKSYAVQAVSWVQGGGVSDTNVDYAADLEALRADIDTDAKAITGQAQTVQLITWQPFPGIAPTIGPGKLYDKYVAAEERFTHIHCAGPSYFLDHESASSLHFTSLDNKWLGAYLGLCYKRVVLDGETWTPLKPLTFTRQGKILLVKFHTPQPPLTFDTDRVALADDYGFQLFTSGGAPIGIDAVSIAGPNTIKILAASTLGATDRLVYGDVGTDYGRITGKRGNLRDSQGDFIVFDGDGLNLPMHNWCVVFDKALG